MRSKPRIHLARSGWSALSTTQPLSGCGRRFRPRPSTPSPSANLGHTAYSRTESRWSAPCPGSGRRGCWRSGLAPRPATDGQPVFGICAGGPPVVLGSHDWKRTGRRHGQSCRIRRQHRPRPRLRDHRSRGRDGRGRRRRTVCPGSGTQIVLLDGVTTPPRTTPSGCATDDRVTGRTLGTQASVTAWAEIEVALAEHGTP
jgi:hypothetical protein